MKDLVEIILPEELISTYVQYILQTTQNWENTSNKRPECLQKNTYDSEFYINQFFLTRSFILTYDICLGNGVLSMFM